MHAEEVINSPQTIEDIEEDVKKHEEDADVKQRTLRYGSNTMYPQCGPRFHSHDVQFK